MVFPLKGRIKTPLLRIRGWALPATPRPRCHKKLVPRRSVDAINVEVEERLGGDRQQAAAKGVGFFEVYVFFFGWISRGHMFFLPNQSWDVVFFCWMDVDGKGSCLVFFVRNINQNHRIHVGCKACNVWMYWTSWKDDQAKNRSMLLQVLLRICRSFQIANIILVCIAV